VLNFLVGFVTAFMSARILEMFGANLYVASLVAISMTRQLGPLVTAIIVCGRSGAAFAAELGTMRVEQEVDALRTFGLQPFGWLVLPRVIALVLVTPVLTLLSDLVGMLGGLVVAVMTLGLTKRMYFNTIRAWLVPWDVESGLWMSAAFGLAIGFISCQQGLSASGGAVSVGERTTKSVVQSLFAIVLLDAAFTVLFRALGLS
jgi:phospholipid/cholesterol/gamma-HCH transport system permease protein